MIEINPQEQPTEKELEKLYGIVKYDKNRFPLEALNWGNKFFAGVIRASWIEAPWYFDTNKIRWS